MTDILQNLHPTLRALCETWLLDCGKELPPDCKVRVNSPVWRDPATQNALFAAGKSNAPAGKSKHEFMLEGKPASKAFDFSCYRAGVYIKDGTDPLYAQAGAIGKRLGLHWGGDWHNPDWDHLELSDDNT